MPHPKESNGDSPSKNRFLFHGAIAFCFALALTGGILLWNIWQSLPNISDTDVLLPMQSIVITDRVGNELYRVYEDEDRTSVDLASLPRHVRDAFIAIEDRRFFERSCIDARAIGRALLANISAYKSQGASTITQQLARMVFLSNDKNVERKIREILLACALERALSKEEILELYLNRVAFGQTIYGIEQAAKRFFGVRAEELSIAQAAVLAALPQRPSYYSPYGPHLYSTLSEAYRMKLLTETSAVPDRIPHDAADVGLLASSENIGDKTIVLDGRANRVLAAMREEGFLSEDNLQSATNALESITFLPQRTTIAAPHFTLWVRDNVLRMMHAENEPKTPRAAGIRIVTTIDTLLQQIAETLIAEKRQTLLSEYGAHNIALIAMERKTSEILAYVGNADYFDDDHDGKVDMARVPRQPGSSFKPIVYASAFERGYGPDSIVRDEPLQLGTYRARNYKSGYFGRMTVRRALAESKNVPALKAFFWAGGEDAVLGTAWRLGARSPLNQRIATRSSSQPDFTYGWPLALGAAETPLLEMVQSYGTLANHGVLSPIQYIREIVNDEGKAILRAPEPSVQAISPEIADSLTSILSDPNVRPQGGWRNVLTLPDTDVAVKTGTSNICAERATSGRCTFMLTNNTWTIGYTPDLVVGVWVGNADNTPLMGEAEGLVTAAPIWREFLVRAQQERGIFQRTFAEETMQKNIAQTPQ